MYNTAGLKCNGYWLESLLAVYIGGGAQYVNVQGIEHWEGMHNVGECTLGVQIF